MNWVFKGKEYMDPLKKDPFPQLSDEELGRLLREQISQNENIEGITNTTTKSQDNWFQKQIKKNHIERFFDGLQFKAEKEFGNDDE